MRGKWKEMTREHVHENNSTKMVCQHGTTGPAHSKQNSERNSNKWATQLYHIARPSRNEISKSFPALSKLSSTRAQIVPKAFPEQIQSIQKHSQNIPRTCQSTPEHPRMSKVSNNVPRACPDRPKLSMSVPERVQSVQKVPRTNSLHSRAAWEHARASPERPRASLENPKAFQNFVATLQSLREFLQVSQSTRKPSSVQELT